MKPAAWTVGNRARLLENGEEYYPRALEAIAAARREIFVETFILFDDVIGKQFHAALIDAGRRGLRVELTVDGYGSADLPAPFVQALTEAGVNVHVYRPQPKMLGFRTNMFRRLHRKIICIDGRLAFVGGINIAHDHVADFGPHSKQDYAVEVEGPVVQQVRAACEVLVAELELRAKGHWRWWQRRRLPPPKNADAPAGQTQACFVIRDNGHHHQDIERRYREAIRNARHRIVIANAYFFPGYRLLRELRNAARRGVDVRLIMQGEPDMKWARWATLTLYQYLMRAGVRIWEYCKRPLHAKVALIDDEWVTVGSSNLDPLSLFLNLECNVILRDRAFNTELHDTLERLTVESCRQVSPQEAPRLELIRRPLTFLVYHFFRRFPRSAGWTPAHTERRGIAQH